MMERIKTVTAWCILCLAGLVLLFGIPALVFPIWKEFTAAIGCLWIIVWAIERVEI